jgi:hypothetical protein
MMNFLSNAVRQQLFDWQKKFGEIDPRFAVSQNWNISKLNFNA